MQSEQGNRFTKRAVAMDELKQRQQSKRLRRRAFYIGLFFVLIAVFSAVCFIVFFKIKNVRIEGATRYTEEEIVEALDVEFGENLYSFNASDKERELVFKLPYLNEVIVERVLPSTVVVHVEEKQPDMYVEISGDKYLLTDSMQILEYTDDAAKLYGLLKLQMDPETVGRCIVGEKLEFADTRTGDAIASAYAEISKAGLSERVNYIDANNRFGIYIGVDGKYDVYMGDVEEFDTKLAFAAGIVDKLSSLSEGENGGDIDVSEINKGIFTPR